MAAKIRDGLFLGDGETSMDTDFLQLNKITNLINLSGHEVRNVFAGHGFVYQTFCWEDRPDFPVFPDMEKDIMDIVEFIDISLRRGLSVLVYSLRGVSRSAMAMCAYLMCKFHWGFEKSYDFVYSKKSDLQINQGFVQQLFALEKRLFARRQKILKSTETATGESDSEALILEKMRRKEWDPKYIVANMHNNTTSSGAGMIAVGRGTNRKDNHTGNSRQTTRRVTTTGEDEMSDNEMEEELLLVNSFLNGKNTITVLPGPFREVLFAPLKSFKLRFNEEIQEEDIHMFPTEPPDSEYLPPLGGILKGMMTTHRNNTALNGNGSQRGSSTTIAGSSSSSKKMQSQSNNNSSKEDDMVGNTTGMRDNIRPPTPTRTSSSSQQPSTQPSMSSSSSPASKGGFFQTSPRGPSNASPNKFATTSHTSRNHNGGIGIASSMAMGAAAMGAEDFNDDRDLYDFVGMGGGHGTGGGARGGGNVHQGGGSSRNGNGNSGIASADNGINLSNSSSQQQPVVFLTAEDRLRHFMREMQLQQQQGKTPAASASAGMGGGGGGGSSDRDRSIAWGDRGGGDRGGGGGSSGSKGSGSGSKSNGFASSSPQQKQQQRHHDHEALADAKHGVGSPYDSIPANRRTNVGLEEEMMMMPSLSLYDLAAMPLEMTVDMEARNKFRDSDYKDIPSSGVMGSGGGGQSGGRNSSQSRMDKGYQDDPSPSTNVLSSGSRSGPDSSSSKSKVSKSLASSLQNMKEKNTVSRGEQERLTVVGNTSSSSLRSPFLRDKQQGTGTGTGVLEHGLSDRQPHTSSMSFDFGMEDQQFDPLSAFQQQGQGGAVRVSYDVSNDLSASFGRNMHKHHVDDQQQQQQQQPHSHHHSHHNNHHHLSRGVVRDAWMDNQDDKIEPREYMASGGGGGQGQRSRGGTPQQSRPLPGNSKTMGAQQQQQQQQQRGGQGSMGEVGISPSGMRHPNYPTEMGEHNNNGGIGGATVRTYRHGSPAPGRVSSTSQSSSRVAKSGNTRGAPSLGGKHPPPLDRGYSPNRGGGPPPPPQPQPQPQPQQYPPSSFSHRRQGSFDSISSFDNISAYDSLNSGTGPVRTLQSNGSEGRFSRPASPGTKIRGSNHNNNGGGGQMHRGTSSGNQGHPNQFISNGSSGGRSSTPTSRGWRF